MCLPLGLVVACGQLDNVPDAAIDANNDGPASESDAQPNDVTAESLADVADSTLPKTDGGACTYAKPSLYYCNGLVPPAPIPVTCGPAAPPTGGVIADGYYELSGAMWDTATFDAACPSSLSRAGALEVCAGNLLWLDVDENNSAYDGSMTYTTNANQLTVNPYCSGSGATYDYTATGSTLRIRIGTSAVLVLTYTLKRRTCRSPDSILPTRSCCECDPTRMRVR